MVCGHFRHDFGSKHVYSIRPANGEEDSQREELAQSLKANILFSRDATWPKLASLLGQGAKMRSTKLTETFDFEAYRISHSKSSVIMFAINEKGRLKIFSNRDELAPEPGWTVIALSPEEDVEEQGNVEDDSSMESDEESTD